MYKVFKFIILFVLLLQCIACDSTFKTEGDFLSWLNEPKNGYVKKTSANGFSLTLKYLPSEYLAYAEYKNEGAVSKELRKKRALEFEDSRTFLLSIEHEVTGVDVSNYGVANMPQFKERINELSFNIKNYIFLKNEAGEKSSPVLTTFENLYEIGGKKTFYVVFSKDLEKETIPEQLDIVFEDPFFDTGINHFMFDIAQIDHSPTLQFIN